MICDAALAMLTEQPASALSLRDLGEFLGVDPTAVYRHFADKDDLLREVGDRALAPAIRGLQPTDDPREDLTRLCLALRRTLLRSPVALTLTSIGPTRLQHELRITEVMLDALLRTGLGDEDAVVGYHVLIEYTLGSALLDAPLAAQGRARAQTYRQWRSDYATLPSQTYPTAVRLAKRLYPPTDQVFQLGLRTLISGLTAQV
jgi:AcrR family transcriptional regulator